MATSSFFSSGNTSSITPNSFEALQNSVSSAVDTAVASAQIVSDALALVGTKATTIALTNEITRATTAEGLKAPLVSPVFTGSPVVPALNGGQLAGMRNRVINGNFDIWQRSTSVTSVTPFYSYYGPDRWQCFRSGGVAGATFSRTNNFDSNATYYLKAQRDSANTSTNPIQVTTSFETLENYKLLGKQITLSFKLLKGADLTGVVMAQVVCGVGTDGNLSNGFTSQSVVCTANISPTTGLTQYSVTGTVPSSATQIGITFTYTPTGTAGANDWFGVTGVQLELGSVATPFEQRPIGLELSLCQRYAQVFKLVSAGAAGITTTAYNTSAVVGVEVKMPEMRSSPTVSNSGVLPNGVLINKLGATVAGSTITITGVSSSALALAAGGTYSVFAGDVYYMSCSAAGSVVLSAEL